MRVEVREMPSVGLVIFALVAAIVAAMAVCSILILWGGASPVEGWILMFKGALGSKFAITETLTRATPLIFTGLAAAVAFRAKLWNIGGEGQFYIGAIMAVLSGTNGQLPSWVMIPYLFAAGALAGGLFLLVPTLLKTFMNVDEVVTTLLLNFVVLLFVNWLVFGPWKDPMAMGWPQSAPVADAAVLPILVARTRLHFGFILALVAAVSSLAFSWKKPCGDLRSGLWVPTPKPAGLQGCL